MHYLFRNTRANRAIAATALTVVILASANSHDASADECKPSGAVAMEHDRSISVEMTGAPPLLIAPDKAAYAGYLEIVGGLAPGERKPYFPVRAIVDRDPAGNLHVFWFGQSVEEGPKEEIVTRQDGRYAWLLENARGLSDGKKGYVPRCG